MRNGAYRRRTNRVGVGKQQVNSARGSQPARFAPNKLSIAPKQAILWGAILLLLLSIAIGTGGKRKEQAPLSAVVKSNDVSAEERPPDAAQSQAVMLKVCVEGRLEEMELEIPKEDTALLELTEQELSKETEEILSCLSPKDQELFRRIFLMEEEPEEAGSALGLTRDNVYVRIFRGKKKIRSKFGERKRA